MRARPQVLDRTAVRQADRRAVDRIGLPVASLMENAGQGLGTVALEVAIANGIRGFAVLAGTGNNGGDGLAAARHLHARGATVRVLLSRPRNAYVGESECGRQLHSVERLGIEASCPDPASLDLAVPGDWLLIDALLGTGIEGPVRDPDRRILAWMAQQPRPVVAADLPSGLDADTGEALGPLPRCAATATFLAVKKGMLMGAGPGHCGRIVVCGLGIAPAALEADPPGP